jgi:hypothetical protein
MIPFQVVKATSAAYHIRSLFVHGGRVGPREKKRCESNFDSVRGLLDIVLDYLRVSLVISILSGMRKRDLVGLIDASFIDRRGEEELSATLSRAWR